MREKLREHVEGLFENAPATATNVEIREEILRNTLEHYDDLIAQGKTEEAAFNIAVAGIGDVSELIRPARSSYSVEELQAARQRSGLMLAVAVMLYILCVLPVILIQSEVGVCLMFIMIAAATGLIIYRGKTKLHYEKDDETMVEEFKQWKEENQEKNSTVKSINAAIGMVFLALYFIISFYTGAWYITWVIFLISVAVQNAVKACFELKK